MDWEIASLLMTSLGAVWFYRSRGVRMFASDFLGSVAFRLARLVDVRLHVRSDALRVDAATLRVVNLAQSNKRIFNVKTNKSCENRKRGTVLTKSEHALTLGTALRRISLSPVQGSPP